MRHSTTTSLYGGSPSILARVKRDGVEVEDEETGECCRGLEHLELWGSAVKWGTDHKFNNSKECCYACKAMCGGVDGPCLCDSWVFCGNKERCGGKFGEVDLDFLPSLSDALVTL